MDADRTRRTLYVSRFPPSHSGVALYSDTFGALLDRLGEVTRLAAPPDSQSLRQGLRGLLAGLRSAGSEVDFIHVELSGRALFEFYFCVGAVLRRSGPVIVVTCHDPPSLVGLPMLFRGLDRRGLRRVGTYMSRLLGRPLERWLMSHVDVRFALTQAGASSLSDKYGATVSAMPHLVDSPTAAPKEHIVFVPGPIDDAQAVRGLLPAIADTPWVVVVGSTTPQVQHELSSASGWAPALTLTGFQSEESLLATFSAAAIVVRVRPALETGGNRLAASGPLAWAVSRGCVCITNDRRAGANELAAQGLVVQTSHPAAALREAILGYDPEDSLRIARTAQALLGMECVASRYVAATERERIAVTRS